MHFGVMLWCWTGCVPYSLEMRSVYTLELQFCAEIGRCALISFFCAEICASSFAPLGLAQRWHTAHWHPSGREFKRRLVFTSITQTVLIVSSVMVS